VTNYPKTFGIEGRYAFIGSIKHEGKGNDKYMLMYGKKSCFEEDLTHPEKDLMESAEMIIYHKQ